jgi:hypothetical protein
VERSEGQGFFWNGCQVATASARRRCGEWCRGGGARGVIGAGRGDASGLGSALGTEHGGDLISLPRGEGSFSLNCLIFMPSPAAPRSASSNRGSACRLPNLKLGLRQRHPASLGAAGGVYPRMRDVLGNPLEG